MTDKTLIVGVLPIRGRATTLHAWRLKSWHPCGRCTGCSLIHYGRECDSPIFSDRVTMLCRLDRAHFHPEMEEQLASFVDDLHRRGASPVTAVGCKSCRKKLVEMGVFEVETAREVQEIKPMP